MADNNRTDAATGEVRAYDARTGALKWSWDPVPQDSADPAYRTWDGPNAHRTGAANAWTVIAADPERGRGFVPTSAPSPDYYGGERLGRNDYANSIVALRASTGKVVWHFQTVHHDLWTHQCFSTLTGNGEGHLHYRIRDGRCSSSIANGQHRFFFESSVRPARCRRRAWPTQPFSSLPALSPTAGWQSPVQPVRAAEGLRKKVFHGRRSKGLL